MQEHVLPVLVCQEYREEEMVIPQRIDSTCLPSIIISGFFFSLLASPLVCNSTFHRHDLHRYQPVIVS